MDQIHSGDDYDFLDKCSCTTQSMMVSDVPQCVEMCYKCVAIMLYHAVQCDTVCYNVIQCATQCAIE